MTWIQNVTKKKRKDNVIDNDWGGRELVRLSGKG